MNFLIIFYLLTTHGDLCEIRELLLLNNFCEAGPEQFITDKGTLYKIKIAMEKEFTKSSYIVCFKKDCFYLKFTGNSYVILEGRMARDIIYFRNSPNAENIFFKIQFFYTNPLSDDSSHFEKYNSNINIVFTYKLLKKKLENNCLSLSNDEIKSRMYYLKQVFLEFINHRFFKITDFLSILDKNKLEEMFKNERMFDLFYFKNHSECLKSLQSFVEYLKRFNLESDKNSESNAGNKVIEMSTGFFHRLNDKFNNDLEVYMKREFNNNKIMILFRKCIDHLKNEIDKKNIMLLIGIEPDIDFYFNEIYGSICKIVHDINEFYDLSSPEIKDYIILDLIESFDKDLLSLQKKSAENFFETNFFLKYFYHLLINVESLDDYINVERIICDYHNMTLYIFNLDNSFKYRNYIYEFIKPPIIVENDYKIVKGFEIEIEKSVFNCVIRASYDKENYITLEKGIHYFINQLNNICIPCDVLVKLKIKKIELELFLKTNGKIFKVFQYLYVEDGYLLK